MMRKTTKLIPLWRHKRSQNAGVVYTLVDEVLAMVDALMTFSFRTEGEFGSPAARVAGHCGMTLWVMYPYVSASRGGKGAHYGAFRQLDLEAVVLSPDGSVQRELGGVAKRGVTRLAAGQGPLGLDRAPWPGGDPAQPGQF